MSYHLYLEIDTGGPEPACVSDWWHYTRNAAPMWRKAMPESDGLAGLHGMTAEKAAVVLRAGIAAMEADPESYRALNPANGWGCFDGPDGQIEMLRQFLADCERHPKASVSVSR